VIAQVAAQEEAPFDLAEDVAEIGVRFRGDRRPLPVAVVHEDIDLKGQERVSSTQRLAHGNAQEGIDRLIGAFEQFEISQRVRLQILQILGQFLRGLVFVQERRKKRRNGKFGNVFVQVLKTFGSFALHGAGLLEVGLNELHQFRLLCVEFLPFGLLEREILALLHRTVVGKSNHDRAHGGDLEGESLAPHLFSRVLEELLLSVVTFFEEFLLPGLVILAGKGPAEVLAKLGQHARDPVTESFAHPLGKIDNPGTVRLLEIMQIAPVFE